MKLKRIAAAEHQQRKVADALREMGVLFNASLDFNTVLDLLLVQVARVVPYDLRKRYDPERTEGCHCTNPRVR